MWSFGDRFSKGDEIGDNESCKKALFNFACFVNVLAISLEN